MIRATIVAFLGLAAAACANVADETGTTEDAVSAPAVGLAVEIENGVGKPLSVKARQTFWFNQIDIRTSITATADEGVDGLRTTGDFAGMGWGGINLEEAEPVLLSNADGTFTRRRFYRGAAWMNIGSTFVLEQLDAGGHVVGTPATVNTGVEQNRADSDSFWDRRMRAIQWTRDCISPTNCAGATNYEEEALVELRLAMHPKQTFQIHPAATALRLRWSQHAPYTIPLTQVASPPFAYGFAIDLEAVTPPNPDGTYAPGTDITFRTTLRDGAGNRLHPPGTLPSYNDVIFGSDVPGIQYYRAFFDPTTTWWRRKHRERMLMAQFLGPAQQAQPIRTIIDLDKFLDADDVQITGTFANDGVYSEFHTFPTAHDLFGGAFDPVHAAWGNPVPDTWTHHVPADAPPGTYYLTMKGRRTYLGEDIAFTRTLEVQVGSTQHTQATLNTGNCTSCHTGPSGLNVVLHANSNRATCAGCHVPLGFELEGPIYVRTHFIHSRSHRFDAPLDNCSTCHLTKESIQRTSKSACLSCHRTYPQWHITDYGPITSIYTGDGRESFAQCTSTCHLTHPNSHL
jgi:hypothetical protein